MRTEILGLVLACPAHTLLAPRTLRGHRSTHAQISRVSGAFPSFGKFFSPGWSGAGPGEGLSVRSGRALWGVNLFRLRLKVLLGAWAARVADSKLHEAHQPRI